MTPRTKSLQLTDEEMDQRVREYLEERENGTLTSFDDEADMREFMHDLRNRPS